MSQTYLTVAAILMTYIFQPTEAPPRPMNFTRQRLLQGTPSIICHRGGALEGRENSMSAIQTCHELGSDGVSVDVRVTRDKQFVLIRDATLERLTGQTEEVKNLNYDQIGPYLDTIQSDFKGEYHKENTEGEKPPTLDAVLDYMVDNDMILSIEEKLDSPFQLEAMLMKIQNKGLMGRVILHTDRNWQQIRDVFGHSLNLTKGTGHIKHFYDQFLKGELESNLQNMDTDIFSTTYEFDSIKDSKYIAVRMDEEFTVEDFLHFAKEKKSEIKVMNRFLHQKRLPVLYYMANTEQDFYESYWMGAHGIVTDRPAELKTWIEFKEWEFRSDLEFMH